MRLAWSEANPSLRMGGPSLAWLAAAFDAADAARAAAPRIATPTLTIAAGTDGPAARRLCAAMPACAEVTLAGAWRDLPREADAYRGRWLDAVDGFMRQRIAASRR
jgi:lysophospholipase